MSIAPMPQTKREIEAMLAQGGLSPRKRFGQNFMIDQNLVRIVADAGEVRADDRVIEVGPGTGTLTEELLSRGARVLAVEIDHDLARLLRERLAGEQRFELIEGDALSGKHALNPRLRQWITGCDSLIGGEAPLPPSKLVANLPYNIASPLIIELLLAGVDVLAFTVQKEVAQRLRAVAGEEAYGALSAMAQLLARVEVLRTLPPQAFWPAPNVESALVRLTRHDRLGPSAAQFGPFITTLFSSRRKTMRRAMQQAGRDPAALDAAGVDPVLRPEDVAPEQFLRLFRAGEHRT